MYASFAKLGAVAITVAVLAVSEASLAGPPRSPYSGVWKPTYAGSRERQHQASDYRARSFRCEAPVQSRRSFSYQPAAGVSFKAGDRVTIASAGVKLRQGRDVIATLPKGQEIRILKVQGQWLGTSIEVDGLKKSGWVLASNTAPIEQSPRPSIEAGDADPERQLQPKASNRSFSRKPARGRYAARDCPLW